MSTITVPPSYQLTRPPHNDGSVIVHSMTTDPYVRVVARLGEQDPDSCWLWPGSTTHNGYGTVGASPPYVAKPRPLLVHRVVYEGAVGPIPQDMEIDHLCRVRLCCNPKHLEVVPKLTNVRRGKASHRGLKTSCKYGHPYPENAIIRRDNGWVFCGACYTRGGKRRDLNV